MDGAKAGGRERAPKGKSAGSEIGDRGSSSQFCREPMPAGSLNCGYPRTGLSMRIKSACAQGKMKKKGNSRQYNLF